MASEVNNWLSIPSSNFSKCTCKFAVEVSLCADCGVDRDRDSLLEITQLLQRNAQDLQETAERTRSLRRSHPQVNVAESIYNRDDRMSVYSAGDSMLASSEINFDFDDMVIDSTVYRRVLAAAKQHTERLNRNEPNEDMADDFDTNHTEQKDIVVDPQVLSRSPSWQPADDQSYLVEHSQKTASPIRSERSHIRQGDVKTCAKCELVFGQFEVSVQAFGATYHHNCFTCKVCSLRCRSRHV
jgi:hypothetical protein